jgi:hypothetical protein
VVNPKTLRHWRAVIQRHPELRELEKPLMPLIGDLQDLRLAGFEGDALRLQMVESIRKRGLLEAYDRLSARIREIELLEKVDLTCQ